MDAATGELTVGNSPTKTSADFVGLLRRLDWRYGPKAECERLPAVLMLDNGPIHTSKVSRAALATRPWTTVEWLPLYAPELNDIERRWRDLKRRHLAHQTFEDASAFAVTTHSAIKQFDKERQAVCPCGKLNKAA